MDDQKLLRLTEVADRLRLSTVSVYKLFNSGELRSLKVGGSRRVHPADLEEYLNAIRARPYAETIR